VHSSISSSDAASTVESTAFRRAPPVGAAVLAAALAVLAFFVVAMELRLAARGIRPTAVDSEELWIRERARADRLGERAIILVGASRIQTGIDLDVLHTRTGLDPVQLAIDGSSFVPVLDGLARDPSICGTVIVGFVDADLVVSAGDRSIAARYEARFETTDGWTSRFSFDTVEGVLTDAIRSRLRSYADGTRPLTSLRERILSASPSPQYAIFLPDRSRLADYSHVDIPAVYYNRVVRELGQDVSFEAGEDYATIDAALARRIDALPEASDAAYGEAIRAVTADAATIEARGGRVRFVAMPTSGLIARIERKRYPRRQFWDRFVAAWPHAVDAEDVPALKAIPVPDGSHIDLRSRRALTNAMLDALDF